MKLRPFKFSLDYIILAEGPGVARGKKNFDFSSLCHPPATHECPQKISAQCNRSSHLAGYREHIYEYLVSLNRLITIINNQKRILRKKSWRSIFSEKNKINSSSLIRQIFFESTVVNQTCHSIHGGVTKNYGYSPFKQFMSLPLSSGLRMCGILCKRKLV